MRPVPPIPRAPNTYHHRSACSTLSTSSSRWTIGQRRAAVCLVQRRQGMVCLPSPKFSACRVCHLRDDHKSTLHRHHSTRSFGASTHRKPHASSRARLHRRTPSSPAGLFHADTKARTFYEPPSTQQQQPPQSPAARLGRHDSSANTLSSQGGRGRGPSNNSANNNNNSQPHLAGVDEVLGGARGAAGGGERPLPVRPKSAAGASPALCVAS